ncbi:hypothetical protein ABZ916_25515 [Streptomyces sp. NPDC046853]|uniref:hypothetical protein n=1 Tax=Streptomyces sp. NPDC046853 TaxID=3154920 RepID=UPI0033D64B1A
MSGGPTPEVSVSGGDGRPGAGAAGGGSSLLRWGLGLLALSQFGVGFWQLFAPRSFYGSLWVSALPPYNEHLMRDLGAMGVALGVVSAAAARSMEPRLVSVALVADLTFTVPHLVFHSTHPGGLSAGSTVMLLGLLGGAVLLPAWLLWLSARRPSRPGGADRTARPAPRP